MTAWVRAAACVGEHNCAEAAWISASTTSTTCVQAHAVDGPHGGQVHVRDSKDPDGPQLVFTLAQWHDVLNRIRAYQHPFGARVEDGSLVWAQTAGGDTVRLVFTWAEWVAFRGGVEVGEFDLERLERAAAEVGRG